MTATTTTKPRSLTEGHPHRRGRHCCDRHLPGGWQHRAATTDASTADAGHEQISPPMDHRCGETEEEKRKEHTDPDRFRIDRRPQTEAPIDGPATNPVYSMRSAAVLYATRSSTPVSAARTVRPKVSSTRMKESRSLVPKGRGPTNAGERRRHREMAQTESGCRQQHRRRACSQEADHGELGGTGDDDHRGEDSQPG